MAFSTAYLAFISLFVSVAYAQTLQPASAPAVLVDIARCESGMVQYDASGDVIESRTHDEGLFQINKSWESTASAMGYDIYSPQGNIKFALYLYDRYGTQPWNSSRPCWQGKLSP